MPAEVEYTYLGDEFVAGPMLFSLPARLVLSGWLMLGIGLSGLCPCGVENRDVCTARPVRSGPAKKCHCCAAGAVGACKMACCRGSQTPPADNPTAKEVRRGDTVVLTVEAIGGALATAHHVTAHDIRWTAVPASLALPSLIDQNVCLVV